MNRWLCREELTVDAHRVLALLVRRVKGRKTKVYTYDPAQLAEALTQGRHVVTEEDVRNAMVELEDLGYIARVGPGQVRVIEECCPPETGMYEKNLPKGMSNSSPTKAMANSAEEDDSYSYPETETDSSIPHGASASSDGRPSSIASPSQARRGLRPRSSGASPSGESKHPVKRGARGTPSGGVQPGRRIVRKPQKQRADAAWDERPTERWNPYNFVTYWEVSRKEHLRPKLRNRENVQWSPGPDILGAAMSRLWKVENMTKPAVREMIDTFWQWVDTGKVKLTTTPWKSFLARRGDLLEAVVRSGSLEKRTSEAPDDDDDDTRAEAAKKWFGSQEDAEAHEEWARKKKWF